MAPTMPQSSDFTLAADSNQSEEKKKALHEIGGVMESIVFGITDIMVNISSLPNFYRPQQ